MNLDDVIDYLPDLVSLPGFFFYSFLAYLITFTITACTAKFVEKHVNL